MGKLKTVHVQVAGLCMIAQRSNMLSVLMPQVEHAGHTHCSYLYVPEQFTEDKKGRMVEIGNRVIRLSDWADKGDVFSLGNIVLEASWLMQGAAIRGRYLDNAPDEDLTTRVELPLGTEPFEPLGERAVLNILGSDRKLTKAFSYGRIGITIDVTEKNQNDFLIRELDLKLLPFDESVEFTLLNIRPKDWQKGPERLRPASFQEPGEHLLHLDAYFKLLSLNGKVPPTIHGPKEGKTGEAKRPDPETCRPLPYASFPRWSGRGAKSAQAAPLEQVSIDPFACTVGGGCPTGAC